MVAPADAPANLAHEQAASQRSSQFWVMLINRIYEVVSLYCPGYGGQMQVVLFIEPPQTDMIEAILSHSGLWESRLQKVPLEADELVLELDPAFAGNALDSTGEVSELCELAYVDIDRFLANF